MTDVQVILTIKTMMPEELALAVLKHVIHLQRQWFRMLREDEVDEAASLHQQNRMSEMQSVVDQILHSELGDRE